MEPSPNAKPVSQDIERAFSLLWGIGRVYDLFGVYAARLFIRKETTFWISVDGLSLRNLAKAIMTHIAISLLRQRCERACAKAQAATRPA